VTQTVVIVSAHAFEARAAASVGRGVQREPWGPWMLYRGEMWDMPLAVIRAGPGKVAAAAAAQAAIQYLDPAVLVSFGTAGSPDSEVEIGSVVVAREVVDVALLGLRDLPVSVPVRHHPASGLVEELLEVPGTRPATVVCWEGHVTSPLHQPPVDEVDGDVLAVDWESAGVAGVARMWSIPWVAVKTISDHGEPDRLKRLAAVARRPLQWSAEVVRRGCDRWTGDAATTQEVEAPSGGSGEDRADAGG